MPVPLEVRGAATAIYRTSFRTLKGLWPATGLVFALLLAHEVAAQAILHQAGGAMRPLWQGLARFALTIVIAPYILNAYRSALGYTAQTLRTQLRERGPLLHLTAWFVLWEAVSRLLDAAASFAGAFPLKVPMLVAVGIAFWWIRIRLSLVRVVLAVGIPTSIRAAVTATAGQFWSITFIGLFVAVPLVPFVIVAFLLAFAAIHTGSDPKAVATVLMSPLSLLGVVLGPAFEVEIYRRLGLHSGATSSPLRGGLIGPR